MFGGLANGLGAIFGANLDIAISDSFSLEGEFAYIIADKEPPGRFPAKRRISPSASFGIPAATLATRSTAPIGRCSTSPTTTASSSTSDGSKRRTTNEPREGRLRSLAIEGVGRPSLGLMRLSRSRKHRSGVPCLSTNHRGAQQLPAPMAMETVACPAIVIPEVPHSHARVARHIGRRSDRRTPRRPAPCTPAAAEQALRSALRHRRPAQTQAAAKRQQSNEPSHTETRSFLLHRARETRVVGAA